MEELYRADPHYTDFTPTTAKEAVQLFHKITDRWSAANWNYMPELMVRLAQDLSGAELDMFEQWIQNPTGVKSGKSVFLEDLHRVAIQGPTSDSDEKTPA